MKAALITAFGGPENLQVGDVPTPSPAGGEVQVGESVAFNSKELVAADQIHAHGDHRAAIDAALARAPAVGVEILLTARND